MTARWTVVVPLLALAALALTWGSDPDGVVVVVVGLFLAGSVLAAVHHAEVVAHRVGEPFGSLVLAVAVTVIEVALIVTLMVSGGDETSTLRHALSRPADVHHERARAGVLERAAGVRRRRVADAVRAVRGRPDHPAS